MTHFDYSPYTKLQDTANYNRANLDRAERVYKEYQTAIGKVGGLITEIQGGTKRGDTLPSLFLKACRALSLLTGDKVLYKTVYEDLKAVYGIALGEPHALDADLQAAERRLEKLKAARERITDPDTAQRVNRAIEAHEDYIKETQELIHEHGG